MDAVTNNLYFLSGQELYNALKGATLFAIKAAQEKGRILILGDQGVNRSATLTVIIYFLLLFRRVVSHEICMIAR
jgi:hypothetical protein